MLQALILSVILLVSLSQAVNRPQFKKAKIRIAGQLLTVEIADSDEKRAYGLMNKSMLGAKEGMLFEFEHPQILRFWMKNTKIPLSIGFFDSNRCLLNHLEMVPEPGVPDESLRRYQSVGIARYAIEVNQDWFKKNSQKKVCDKKIGDFNFVEP